MAKNRNQQSPTWLQNVSSYFSQYCSATSIHGVKYLGERGRFILEKLIWIILITSVCYFCNKFIIKSYRKWKTSPAIVSFGTEETPIYNIPFPAVTICPETKTDPSIFNFTDVALRIMNKEPVTSNERYFCGNMSLVCDNMRNFDILKKLDKYTRVDPLPTLIKMFPDYSENPFSFWMRDNEPHKYFSLTYTEYGLCYNFNMLHYKEILNDPEEIHFNFSLPNTFIKNWDLENGYHSPFLNDIYPRRSYLSGLAGGLRVMIHTNDSYIDHLCGINPEGFKVILHSPSDWPSMDRHFYVSLDEVTLIAIKPKLITISKPLKGYSPLDRKCYLSNERKLKYFKIYSQENCLVECLANFTMQSCGCFPFYMPHRSEDFICSLGSLKCIEISKVKFYTFDKDRDSSNCNCLPSCTSLTYDIEISQSHWNWRKYFKILRTMGLIKESLTEDKWGHVSSMFIYYKERQFLNAERNELYGYLEFFSSIGGLLGLFIGISVISGFEIIYFLTLRLACNIKMYGKNYWSGEKHLMNDSSETIT